MSARRITARDKQVTVTMTLREWDDVHGGLLDPRFKHDFEHDGSAHCKCAIARAIREGYGMSEPEAD